MNTRGSPDETEGGPVCHSSIDNDFLGRHMEETIKENIFCAQEESNLL